MIETRRLSIGYSVKEGKSKLIKESINVRLIPGEVTCLMGRNGAGKSTLIRTLGGFIPALSGEILLEDRPADSFSNEEKARRLGVVLTDKTNAGGITVFELVSLGRHPHTNFFGVLKDKDKSVITSSMEKVGIAHKSDAYLSELSDGERQKAMIAKVLAQECPVILLDEPTAFLDLNSRIEVMELLRKLALEEHKTILLSTHDIESALRLGSRIWLMDKEKDFLSGTPEELVGSGLFDSYFDLEKYPGWSGKNYVRIMNEL